MTQKRNKERDDDKAIQLASLRKVNKLDHAIQLTSLQEMKKLVKEMQPSGKINDIHAIRLFLLGIISKIEDITK